MQEADDVNVHRADMPREEPTAWSSRDWAAAVHGHGDKPVGSPPLTREPSDRPWTTVADAALVSIGEDDQGLAAGQYAAFYNGSVCLGCAIILGVPADDESENVSPAAWAAAQVKELPKKVQPPKERKQTLMDNEEKKAMRNIAKMMS